MNKLKHFLGTLILIIAVAAVAISQAPTSYNFTTATIQNLNGGGNAFFQVVGPASSVKSYTLENASRSLPSIIDADTSALGAASINAGACASTVTTTATGALATDFVLTNFGADPTATAGYLPGEMLTIVAWPSTGNVNYKVCNNSPDPIDPDGLTLHWVVLRVP